MAFAYYIMTITIGLVESIWPYVVAVPCKGTTCIFSFSFHLILQGKYNNPCLIDTPLELREFKSFV